VPLLLLAWHHKAAQEELLMLQQFGDEYERYRREVKGLIPHIW
jgi:protein-S-isoprenylcysteine O-methyltransferase Ste14